MVIGSKADLKSGGRGLVSRSDQKAGVVYR